MMKQVLASPEENGVKFADHECPDCYAPLLVYYDEDGHKRYQCENCGQPASARDVDADWDDYQEEKGSDSHISTDYSA